MPKELELSQEAFEFLGRHLGLMDFLAVKGPEDLRQQIPSASLWRYGRGEAVVKEGEEGGDIYVLFRGDLSVRVAWMGPLTKEVARLAPGDMFGEVGFLVQRPRSATVKARGGAAEVLRFGAVDVQKIFETNPRFAASMAALVKARTQKLR